MFQLSKISKSYGARRVLDAVSLQLKTGRLVGLVGSNGAGKTTLVKIATGLCPPDSGEIVIEGRKMNARDREMKRLIGYVPCEAWLSPWLTPLEQIEFVLSLWGMDPRHHWPEVERTMYLLGLEACATTRNSNLSAGERHKVGLAAALLIHPRYLFLDEPFNSLDTKSRWRLGHRLRALADAGVGILLVTHDLAALPGSFDEVHCLDNGSLFPMSEEGNRFTDTPDGRDGGSSPDLLKSGILM